MPRSVRGSGQFHVACLPLRAGRSSPGYGVPTGDEYARSDETPRWPAGLPRGCAAGIAPALMSTRWGLTPHSAANDASLWRRSGLSPIVIIKVVALSGPMPTGCAAGSSGALPPPRRRREQRPDPRSTERRTGRGPSPSSWKIVRGSPSNCGCGHRTVEVDASNSGSPARPSRNPKVWPRERKLTA